MAKKTGHGVSFQIDEASNGTFVTVAQVTSMQGVDDIVVGEVDATTLDDVLAPYMIPPSVNEYPVVTLGIAWDPNSATHATLRTLTNARTSYAAKVVLSNYSTTKTWQCSAGYNTEFRKGEINSKGLMTGTVIYRPQAVPSFS